MALYKGSLDQLFLQIFQRPFSLPGITLRRKKKGKILGSELISRDHESGSLNGIL